MKSKRKSRRINSYTKPKTVKQSVKFPFKRVRGPLLVSDCRGIVIVL